MIAIVFTKCHSVFCFFSETVVVAIVHRGQWIKYPRGRMPGIFARGNLKACVFHIWSTLVWWTGVFVPGASCGNCVYRWHSRCFWALRLTWPLGMETGRPSAFYSTTTPWLVGFVCLVVACLLRVCIRKEQRIETLQILGIFSVLWEQDLSLPSNWWRHRCLIGIGRLIHSLDVAFHVPTFVSPDCLCASFSWLKAFRYLICWYL